MKSKIITGLLLWALIAVALALWIGSESWMTYYRLSRSGNLTRGVVTAKEPHNHQLVRYSYSVAGESFSGAGGLRSGNRSFEDMQEGDEVLVAYDPEEPWTSCLCDPRARLRAESAFIAAAAIIGSALIVLSIFARRGRQRPGGA